MARKLAPEADAPKEEAPTAPSISAIKDRLDEVEGDLHRVVALLGQQFGGVFEAKLKEIIAQKQGRG